MYIRRNRIGTLNIEYRILLLWMRVVCTGKTLTLQGPHGNTLVVQGLRLCSFTAGGEDSVPGPGTKIPHWHTVWPKQKQKIQRPYDL